MPRELYNGVERLSATSAQLTQLEESLRTLNEVLADPEAGATVVEAYLERVQQNLNHISFALEPVQNFINRTRG